MNTSFKVGISSTLKGIRGIIAERHILKDELIETCPVIVFPKTQDSLIDVTILGAYDYNWDENNSCFVLGYCVLTNHSYEPNCRYERDYENRCMKYVALKDIAKDEEILINYNGNSPKEEPLAKRYTDHSL